MIQPHQTSEKFYLLVQVAAESPLCRFRHFLPSQCAEEGQIAHVSRWLGWDSLPGKLFSKTITLNPKGHSARLNLCNKASDHCLNLEKEFFHYDAHSNHILSLLSFFSNLNNYSVWQKYRKIWKSCVKHGEFSYSEHIHVTSIQIKKLNITNIPDIYLKPPSISIPQW